MVYQENPKTVQISYELFITISNLLNYIKVDDGYSKEIQEMYKQARAGMYEKGCRIRNRKCYTEITQAQTDDEKEAAVDNYLKTKELSKHCL